MSVLYWIHVKCLTCTEHMSVCERCLSCSSWPFQLIFPSVLLLMWSNEAGASVGIRHGPDRGGQNKQSKANMAGPFKCSSQVHAQTHTRKPQTHFCQRGERPSYRRLQRDRNDGIKDGGAQPSAARLRSARRPFNCESVSARLSSLSLSILLSCFQLI